MPYRIGSLFSGYGGLDLAVASVYDARPVWHCEFDPAPSRILSHHWPDVPNLEDVTTVDWSGVEPIDILTGGFPCQDVSVAGRRAGMNVTTRSGLWSYMRTAVDVLRPGLVVIENVGGLFSATANRIVEPCTYGMGDDGSGGHTVFLRAADAVLGDLATIGYDAEWVAVRASDVGAPHGRLRVFITAHPADASGGGGRGRATVPVASSAGVADASPVRADHRPGASRDAPRLMPTQEAKLGSSGPDYARANRVGSGGDDLATASVRIADEQGLSPATAMGETDFGPYAPAIRRWEQVLGRPAPAPTEPGRTRPRLSARFVEWLMGLPEGHVTDTPGLTRNQKLKALGNGVVPLQAIAALERLHGIRQQTIFDALEATP